MLVSAIASWRLIWLNLSFMPSCWYHGWSVVASTALSIHLRGYISPGPSVSFLSKQRRGDHFVSDKDSSFKVIDLYLFWLINHTNKGFTFEFDIRLCFNKLVQLTGWDRYCIYLDFSLSGIQSPVLIRFLWRKPLQPERSRTPSPIGDGYLWFWAYLPSPCPDLYSIVFYYFSHIKRFHKRIVSLQGERAIDNWTHFICKAKIVFYLLAAVYVDKISPTKSVLVI